MKPLPRSQVTHPEGPPTAGAAAAVQDVLEALPGEAALLDRHGRIVAVNDAWRRGALGIRPALPGGGVGSSMLDFPGPGSANEAGGPDGLAEPLRDVLSGLRPRHQSVLLHPGPDGPRRIECVATSLPATSSFGATIQFRDVTGSQDSIDRRLDAEEQVRLLFTRSDRAMWIVEPVAGVILERNAEAECRYGGGPDGVLAAALRETERRFTPGIGASRSASVWQRTDARGEVRDVEFTSQVLMHRGREARLLVEEDVTERRLAREEVFEARRGYESLLRVLGDLVYETNLRTGRTCVVACSGKPLLGERPERWLAGPELWESLIHPEDRPAVRAAWDDARGRFREQEIEYRVRTEQGGSHWVQERTVLVPATGRPERMHRILRDVSRERAAERAQAEVEERFRRIVETAYEGVWTFDITGRTTYVNRRMAELLRYSPEELMHVPVARLLPPDELAKLPERRARWQQGRHGNAFARFIRSDGSLLEAQVSASPLPAARGQPAGLLLMVTDVSELRRTEERLREQHSLLEGILENTEDLIYVKDRDFRYKAVNRALAAVHGDDPKELIGAEWPPMFPEASRAEIRRLEREVLATGESRVSEVTIARGEPRTFLVTRTPCRDDDGRIVGLVGVGKDITDRLKAEAAAERFHRQLRHSARMEAVGQLASGVAHDFNNLLTAIFGSVEIARGLTSPEDPRYEELEQIRRASEHAAQLTRQLLAFGRLQVLEPRALDLNRLLTDLDRLLRRVIDASIAFELAPAEGLGTVFVDPSQVEQIVINLVVNARDAMPRGGRLLIETANVHLDEAYARHHAEVKAGDYVMLAVSDTGTGIDPVTMERLFEPFFTTKATGSGTGLGLATVHGIVKQSGGHVWPYSEVGVGTTFKVYFPRLTNFDPVPEPAPGRSPAAPGGSETILVVEDNDVLAKVTVRLLQSAGYRVLLAPTPEAALQLCGQERRGIQLVISDVVMPQFDGFELRDRLQALDPSLRVILTSGYSERRVRAEGLDDGTPFLPKPFTRDELLRCVRATLELRDGGGAG